MYKRQITNGSNLLKGYPDFGHAWAYLILIAIFIGIISVSYTHLFSVCLADVGNRHVTDGSLDFGQRKDVFHQLCHFGACEIFDLRGKALNRAAQIAKTVGCLLYTSRCV